MRMISLKTLAVAMAVVLGMAFQAQALTIDPATTPACGLPVCLEASGNETSQNEINAIIAAFVGTELYKSEVDGGGEFGAFAGNYTTTYFNTATDPSDADIVWDGGAFITGNPIHLLVKDGNATPAWYLFNITGWDGMETIELRNFWPNQGAISHISIYGNGTSVPDGGSVALLLGMALMGLAGFRRMMN
jgi:hypothetical protein